MDDIYTHSSFLLIFHVASGVLSGIRLVVYCRLFPYGGLPARRLVRCPLEQDSWSKEVCERPNRLCGKCANLLPGQWRPF